MEKNERVLRKRYSHNQPSGGNTGERRSSHRIHSNILQDESLPSMRSLHSKSLLERKKRERKCMCVCVRVYVVDVFVCVYVFMFMCECVVCVCV